MTNPPDAVHDLIDRYRRREYNETQVRREFIDLLFEALGWDVSNKAGVAPQYREVVHEAALRQDDGRAGVVAPDYLFRVGPARKFFVQAKRPDVDMRRAPLPAYELRRYACTGQLLLKDEVLFSYALRGFKDNLEMESFIGHSKDEERSLFLDAQHRRVGSGSRLPIGILRHKPELFQPRLPAATDVHRIGRCRLGMGIFAGNRSKTSELTYALTRSR